MRFSRTTKQAAEMGQSTMTNGAWRLMGFSMDGLLRNGVDGRGRDKKEAGPPFWPVGKFRVLYFG